MDTLEIEFDASRFTMISQGAEARVWEGLFLSQPAIIKQRFKKNYRHPTLDEKLTSTRFKQEVRCMLKSRKLGIRTPTVYHVDDKTNSIYMEKINGHSIKTIIHQGHLSAQGLEDLASAIGRLVAKLHDGSIIHGDLTTSNMMLADVEEGATTMPGDMQRNLVLIDFGLSYISTISEDKAVDLYVLERAFTSAHAEEGPQLFESVLKAYKSSSKQWCSTLNKFAEVRMRGRKRTMVG